MSDQQLISLRCRHLMDQIHAFTQRDPVFQLVGRYAQDVYEAGNSSKDGPELVGRFVKKLPPDQRRRFVALTNLKHDLEVALEMID